jgi:hypothetical protein
MDSHCSKAITKDNQIGLYLTSLLFILSILLAIVIEACERRMWRVRNRRLENFNVHPLHLE